MNNSIKLLAAGFGLFIANVLPTGGYAQTSQVNTADDEAVTTTTDFLSDEDWMKLPEETRKKRLRRHRLSRYELSGNGDISKLNEYIDKFAKFNIYDPRLFIYNVQATAVPNTTDTIELKGEVLLEHYKLGLEGVMKGLGFTIAKNSIEVLPSASVEKPYGFSKVGMATIRKEPRSRAEQINSVPMGGWIRVLRTANDSDITNAQVSPRHAPGGKDAPANDTPADWFLIQSLEGYIGYVRKGEFEYRNDFDAPEGIVRVPMQVLMKDIQTTVPAGAFVYRKGDNWALESGEKLPVTAEVTDVRPKITANGILALSKPLMKTSYVWGGTTEAGIDCSGFSQFIYRSLGGFLPRDAEEQAATGLIVGWGKDVAKKAKPGDLIFFRNDSGRVGHVAVSLGENDIIHSAGPGVHRAKLSDEETTTTQILDGVLFARRPFVPGN